MVGEMADEKAVSRAAKKVGQKAVCSAEM